MNDNNTTKSVVLGWVMLAGAYVLGRKHGQEKCMNNIKDILLKGFIKEKEEQGS